MITGNFARLIRCRTLPVGTRAAVAMTVGCLLLCWCLAATAADPCSSGSQTGLVLTGNQVVTIEGETYCMEGGITVQDSAHLIIRSTTLVVHQDYDWQHSIRVLDDGILELTDVIFESDRAVQVVGQDDAQLDLSMVAGSFPWRVMVFDRSSSRIDNVDMSALNLFGRTRTEVSRSTIHGAIDLAVGEMTIIELQGIQSGYFEDWFVQSIVKSGELPLALSLQDTEVGNWGIVVSRGARASISDSHVVHVSLELAGTSGTISGLRPGRFGEWSLEDFGLQDASCTLDLKNTLVDEWVLRDGSQCDLSIEGSQISLVLWGEGLSLSASASVFPWTGISYVSWASFSMQQCTIEGYLRLVDAHVSIEGGVHFARPLELGAWHSSSVRRTYDVLVHDADGNPLSYAAVRITDQYGRLVTEGMTTRGGQYTFQIKFNDSNRTRTWSVSLPELGVTETFGFFSDSPILLVVK